MSDRVDSGCILSLDDFGLRGRNTRGRRVKTGQSVDAQIRRETRRPATHARSARLEIDELTPRADESRVEIHWFRDSYFHRRVRLDARG